MSSGKRKQPLGTSIHNIAANNLTNLSDASFAILSSKEEIVTLKLDMVSSNSAILIFISFSDKTQMCEYIIEQLLLWDLRLIFEITIEDYTSTLEF